MTWKKIIADNQTGILKTVRPDSSGLVAPPTYPAGRECKYKDENGIKCTTILSIYNSNNVCANHGGNNEPVSMRALMADIPVIQQQLEEIRERAGQGKKVEKTDQDTEDDAMVEKIRALFPGGMVKGNIRMGWKKITEDAQIIPVDFKKRKRLPDGTTPPPLPKSQLKKKEFPQINLYEDTREFDPCESCGSQSFNVLNRKLARCTSCKTVYQYTIQ